MKYRVAWLNSVILRVGWGMGRRDGRGERRRTAEIRGTLHARHPTAEPKSADEQRDLCAGKPPRFRETGKIFAGGFEINGFSGQHFPRAGD